MNTGNGLLVIMGSGETAPTMVKPHRAIFERVGDRPAVVLDTPYGFQSNADDISARAVRYFAASVGRDVSVLSWRRPPDNPLDRERALGTLRDAGWIFAGPGSPTYSLRQWRDTPIPTILADTLATGGVVSFASAAALTLGSHTIPVYEIYKAGVDPHWVPGLDLVRQLTGLPAVVVPHYDNAEGGHHDTRFCYLGEQRLAAMEADLPDDAFLLGVDEHTAVTLDLATRLVTVTGRGCLTVRSHCRSTIYPSGTETSIEHLGAAGRGEAAAGRGEAAAGRGEAAAGRGEAADEPPGRPLPTTGQPADRRTAPPLVAATTAEAARFHTALDSGNVDNAVAAILALEEIIEEWGADTEEDGGTEQSRAVLRSLVVRLGTVAVRGTLDRREIIAPYVATLLDLRERARQNADYALSDWIRTRLSQANVDVQDTRTGADWFLRTPEESTPRSAPPRAAD